MPVNTGGDSKIGIEYSLPCNFCATWTSRNRRCSRCLSVFYCSKSCQQKDWKGESGGISTTPHPKSCCRPTPEHLRDIKIVPVNYGFLYELACFLCSVLPDLKIARQAYEAATEINHRQFDLVPGMRSTLLITVNGDFLPRRLQAQQDAVNLLTQTKLRANPESNVGLKTLSELNVLVTLTTKSGKILSKLHSVAPKGNMKFVQGIKIAHLALKHRQGKNHKTRIVAFVGSPIIDSKAALTKLAKKLKKEKVSIDIVSFGESEENSDKLQKFVETINGKDGTGSHFVTIPPGPHLSDALISSPILQSEDGSGPNIVAGGIGGFDLRIDPNDDPELTLALRISMEEHRAQQEAENRTNQESGNTESTGAATEYPDSEEAMLQRALGMSMQGEASSAASKTESKGAPDVGSITKEEQIAWAMQMSMQDNTPDEPSASKDNRKNEEEAMEVHEDYSEAMNDPAFLQGVLENLPGVDPQSEAVRSAMGAATGQHKKDSDKKKEDKEEMK